MSATNKATKAVSKYAALMMVTTAACTALVTTSAKAALTLEISSPQVNSDIPVTVTEVGNSGTVLFGSQAFGTEFSLVFAFGETNQDTGGAAADLQLTGLNITSSGIGSGSSQITVELSDNFFGFPGNPGDMLTLDSSVGGTLEDQTIGDTVSFQSFEDNGNNLFGVGSVSTPLQLFTAATTNQISLSSDQTTTFTRSSDYSLTNVINVSMSANGEVNYSGTTSADTVQVNVPEPASLSMIVLAGVGLLARRGRKCASVVE